MKYSVEILAIKEDEVIAKAKTYEFESNEILNHLNKSKLAKEAINFFKEKEKTLKDQTLIVDKIDFSCLAIEKNFKEVPKELEQIYTTSKKEYQEYLKTPAWASDQLYYMMQTLISNAKQIRQQAQVLNILDSQEWLDYQDELNKLSIDPDR